MTKVQDNPCHAEYFHVQILLPNFHPINPQDSSIEHVFISWVENSKDPDQLASQKTADLDLQCFEKGINLGSAG